MTAEDFDFALPPELIAQHPLAERDGARLFHVQRGAGRFTHRRFVDLPSLLRKGDVLVFNDTRVIRARLLGHKRGTGGKAELLLLHPAKDVTAVSALGAHASGAEWWCLGQASKGLKVGQWLDFAGGVSAEIVEAKGGGDYRARLWSDRPLDSALEEAGRLPLPPYISREPEADDAARYQTVYAREPGSVAAPTAGLHFSEPVMAALDGAGVERRFVTLDVGAGTFMPVREGPLSAHVMHRERYRVPDETAAAVSRARQEGRRVIAVGTTSLRTLEAASTDEGLKAGAGDTALFIYPGYTFRTVDALVTNFHLPRSSLVMLVSAFIGSRSVCLDAYAEAVREKYRFFSYGDAMFIESAP
ncbi:MAG: tRNA preQ1(34) S-adenosylmethionine ribosyltransferase-isomerase QueA [Myxococcaceae bacterium]|nr:tRNA preQ1(34) S-adenosylmethionine ribosyltransferase-isomerase QueA [Myxococcaceae bacterium]